MVFDHFWLLAHASCGGSPEGFPRGALESCMLTPPSHSEIRRIHAEFANVPLLGSWLTPFAEAFLKAPQGEL